MSRFDATRKIGGNVPMLRDRIMEYTEILFPGAFELLAHPEYWTGGEADWFPIQPHDASKSCWTFEVVDAPLPFVAACVRIDGPCSIVHRFFVVNSSFHIAATHLAASSVGTGLQPGNLRELLRTLYLDPTKIADFEPAKSAPIEEIFAGIAWLLFHEYGHVVGSKPIPETFVRGAERFRAEVTAELNADHAAVQALHHRSLANKQTGSAFPTLICGIELILRTMAAVAPSGECPNTLIETCADLSVGHPSPFDRWETIRSYVETCFKLGLEGRHEWRALRKERFANFDETVRDIREGWACHS